MRLTIARYIAGCLLVLMGCVAPSAAQAQTCTFTVTDINFGIVDPLGGNVNTMGTITGSCTGIPLLPIKICPNIGSGSGGADASTRYMTQGANTLAYNLYVSSGGGGGNVWGSNLWPYTPRPPRLDVTLNALGTGTLPATIIHARVPSGQTGAVAGPYSSTFSGGHVAFNYVYGSGGTCNTPLFGAQTHRPVFNVLAVVQGACTVNAADLNFGTAGLLDANIDASSNVTVKCPISTPYTVALGPGSAGSGAAARTMVLGGNVVSYDIYRDAGRTLKWGNTVGTTVAGTGTGADQTIPAYGRVPVQDTPTAGAYADTVVVTVTY